MSCTTCGSVEMFENFPWLKEEKFAEEEKPSSCSQKSKCLYTAQGVYVCEAEKGIAPDAGVNGGNKGVAMTASPWLTRN